MRLPCRECKTETECPDANDPAEVKGLFEDGYTITAEWAVCPNGHRFAYPMATKADWPWL